MNVTQIERLSVKDLDDINEAIDKYSELLAFFGYDLL